MVCDAQGRDLPSSARIMSLKDILDDICATTSQSMAQTETSSSSCPENGGISFAADAISSQISYHDLLAFETVGG